MGNSLREWFREECVKACHKMERFFFGREPLHEIWEGTRPPQNFGNDFLINIYRLCLAWKGNSGVEKSSQSISVFSGRQNNSHFLLSCSGLYASFGGGWFHCTPSFPMRRSIIIYAISKGHLVPGGTLFLKLGSMCACLQAATAVSSIMISSLPPVQKMSYELKRILEKEEDMKEEIYIPEKKQSSSLCTSPNCPL